MNGPTSSFLPFWLYDPATLMPWLATLTARYVYGGGAAAAPSLFSGSAPDIDPMQPGGTIDTWFQSNQVTTPALTWTPDQFVGMAAAWSTNGSTAFAAAWGSFAATDNTKMFTPAGSVSVPAAPSGADTLWLVFTDSSGNVKAYSPLVGTDNSADEAAIASINAYAGVAFAGGDKVNASPDSATLPFNVFLQNNTTNVGITRFGSVTSIDVRSHLPGRIGWAPGAIPSGAAATLKSTLLGATTEVAVMAENGAYELAQQTAQAVSSSVSTSAVKYPALTLTTANLSNAQNVVNTAWHYATLPAYLWVVAQPGYVSPAINLCLGIYAPEITLPTLSQLPWTYAIPAGDLVLDLTNGTSTFSPNAVQIQDLGTLHGTAPAPTGSGTLVQPSMALAGTAQGATAAMTITNAPLWVLQALAAEPVGSGILVTQGLAGIAAAPTGYFELVPVRQALLQATAQPPTGALTVINGNTVSLSGRAPAPRGSFSAVLSAYAELLGVAPAPLGRFELSQSVALALHGVAAAPQGAFELARVATLALAGVAQSPRASALLVQNGTRDNFAMLAQTRSLTHMPSSPYRELVQVGADVYALTAAGLVLVGADTDAGAPVLGSLTTYPVSLNKQHQGRLQSAYLNGAINGGTLRVTAEWNKAEGTYDYAFVAARAGLWQQRVPLGRGLRADRITLTAQLVGPATLTTIDLPIIEGHRRL